MIGSNRPGRICPEIATWVRRGLRATELGEIELIDLQELKTDEAMLTDDGNFHEIDAAFADYLPQVTTLATELNHLVDGHAKAKPHKPTSTKPNS